ncbi:MAG: CRISPR system precrRNA processing endoribonuclease RAMP protein Cas6 [Candidatus Binatia bacterium]
MSQHAIPRFRFAQYRLSLIPQEPLTLPTHSKGNTIRGGFGTVFRRLVCVDLRLDCAVCELRYTCPYTQVFNPFIPPEAERLRKNQNIPRPFVIKPPLETKTQYRPGEILRFDFVVIGEAMNYLPYFVVAFRELADVGFGLNRARCVLATITTVDLHGGERILYNGAEGVVHPPQEHLTWQMLTPQVATLAERQELTIRFLTPTTLKAEGEVVMVPQFHQLIKRVRDRINALATFFCGGALDLDFRALGQQAEAVKEVAVHSQWIERTRRTRKGFAQDQSGFVGSVTYRGDFTPFLPLLLLGEYIHAGKNAAFGNGWYRIERQE